MSYILDALKKAESERKLGSVPNVYMEPVPMAESEEPLPPWRRPAVWIAMLLLASVGIAAVWMMSARKSETPSASVSTAPVVVAQAADQAEPAQGKNLANAVPAPGAAQSPKGALKKEPTEQASKKEAPARKMKPAEPPKAAAATAVTPPRKEAAHAKAAPPVKEPAPERQQAKPPGRTEPERGGNAPANPAIAAASQPAPEMQVSALRDLPEHIRRGIPPIAIGGYIYSPNPAERSMLLNNRLIREGEQAASGLILEKMMPKEAVLNYQGQRFRLAY
ncbi:MAG: general secretion pathway protein GspB [Burkholderiaceae bacterium]